MSKICKICKSTFLTTRSRYLFCSKDCAKIGTKISNRAYYERNKDKKKISTKQWHKEHGTNDIQFKLARNLRSRLRQAIKTHAKIGSAVEELGCTIEQFKLYLESKFEPWMNWDNYGRYDHLCLTWQIDHMIPLSRFDLTNKDQFLNACHYTNLQPMLSEKNLRKSKK